MPFIPAALLPAIIGAGASVGSTVIGSKLAKSKASPLEQQSLDRANRAGERGDVMSQNLFDLGQPSTQQPMNYWSSILSGNRGQMTSAMAPEASRIGEGYRAAGQASAALNPRGGPSTNFLAEQPYQQQRDISTLFQQARPQAAQQLAGSGSNLLANAINALYGSTAAGRDVLNFEQQRRDRDREAGGAIGKTIYDIFYPAQGQGGLASVLGDIFKPKVPGAPSSSSTQNFNVSTARG
jgi:hypothetical protein